jgi:PPOX class probable F420-dependent enzyme
MNPLNRGTPGVRLTDQQRAFLDEPRFAVVATVSPGGLPHQTVMWFLRDGDRLVLSCPRDSLKHRHLRRDNRLSVCVEDGFRYLTLSGTVTLDDADHAEARATYAEIGRRYLGALRGAGRPAPPDPKIAELLRRERVTLRLTVDHVHGSGW